MKITIGRKDLLAALSRIRGTVERRGTIPILSNVKLVAADGRLKLTGTDMDLEVVADIPAEVSEPGATTVVANTLFEIANRLPDGAEVHMDTAGDTGRVQVRSGRSRFTLQCLPVDDFPLMAGGSLPHTFRIAAGEMKGLIDRTRIAISTDETRYYLTGIYMHAAERDGVAVLRVVATDGHVLASAEVPLPDGAAGMPGVIVPRKTVTEVRKLMDGSADDVDVSLSESMIRFACGGAVLTSKLIDGTFPDYQRVIPVGNDKRLAVDREAFIAAVGLVSVMSGGDARAVKISLAADTLTLSAGNGNASEEMDAQYEGPPLEIGFNSRYLLDVAKQSDGETMEVTMSGALDPAILRDPTDASAFCVLMPLRVG